MKGFKGLGINRLTPQPSRAYCVIIGDLIDRIIKEGRGRLSLVPVKAFSGRPGLDPRAGEDVNLTIFLLPLTTTAVQKTSAAPPQSLNREWYKVELLVDRVTPIVTHLFHSNNYEHLPISDPSVTIVLE